MFSLQVTQTLIIATLTCIHLLKAAVYSLRDSNKMKRKVFVDVSDIRGS